MNILYTIIFSFLGLWASAQNLSEASVQEKNGKVHIELLVKLSEVESILTDENNCDGGVAISFCFRNYVNENLELAINNGENLDFIIEASISNQKELQINLSAETDDLPVTSYQVTNNLFVDDILNYINKMTFDINGNKQTVNLDTQNRTVSID